MAELLEQHFLYTGKVKIVQTHQLRLLVLSGAEVRVREARVRKRVREVPSMQAAKKRVKLVRQMVKRVGSPEAVVGKIVLQFWQEVGASMLACLSPRNFTSSRKLKKPRRLFVPPTIFQEVERPMLNAMATGRGLR